MSEPSLWRMVRSDLLLPLLWLASIYGIGWLIGSGIVGLIYWIAGP